MADRSSRALLPVALVDFFLCKVIARKKIGLPLLDNLCLQSLCLLIVLHE
jgi:hypothetical protein